MRFVPKNNKLEEFKMSLFLWGVLTEQAFGTYFPTISKNGSSYYLFGVDPRFTDNSYGIDPIDLEDFYVTTEESKVLARMTDYYVRIQKSMSENEKKHPPNPFQTLKSIREDWIEKLDEFAKWLQTCEGFELKEDN